MIAERVWIPGTGSDTHTSFLVSGAWLDRRADGLIAGAAALLWSEQLGCKCNKNRCNLHIRTHTHQSRCCVIGSHPPRRRPWALHSNAPASECPREVHRWLWGPVLAVIPRLWNIVTWLINKSRRGCRYVDNFWEAKKKRSAAPRRAQQERFSSRLENEEEKKKCQAVTHPPQLTKKASRRVSPGMSQELWLSWIVHVNKWFRCVQESLRLPRCTLHKKQI